MLKSLAETLHSEPLSPKTYIQNLSRRNPTFRTSLTERNVSYRTSKSRPEISRKSRQDLFSWSFCLVSGRDPHVCGNVHGKVEIPQSTRTRTRTRTRASSGGEGRHGERRGGAKRIARGLKTRARPQMMVMMARVAFRAVKTKNGAAIAVRVGGHDIGRTNPTSWASARASTASGSHRRLGGPSTHTW